MIAVSCGGAVRTPSSILLTQQSLARPVLLAPLPWGDTTVPLPQTQAGTEGLYGMNKELIANYSHPRTGPVYPPVPAEGQRVLGECSQQPPFPVGPCG